MSADPTSEPINDSDTPSLDDPSADSGEANLNLDALLDLAEQDPQRLSNIHVNDVPASTLGDLSPDAVFRPESSSSGAANSTGDLLSRAPGVILRSTSAVNQDARLRGFSGSQVVGVANGIQQVKIRLDIDSLFSQIDPSLVESVSVLAGPYTVLHGPGYAFFDARLIQPSRSSQLEWQSKSASGFNSNGRQIFWRETASFSDADSGALISLGQRIGSDYRPGGGGDDFRVPASYNVRDLYAAISVDLSERSRIDTSYLRQVLQSTELPGVAYDIDDQHTDQLDLRWSLTDDFTGRDRLQAQFWWSQTTYQVDASQAAKQQTFWTRLIGEPYPDALNGTMIGGGQSDSWGTRLVTIWGDGERWDVKAGADWRRVRQVYRERDFQADGSPALFGDTFGLPESTSDDFGVFAGGTLNLTDTWTVGLGQRLDWVRYGVDGNDSVVTTTGFAPNNQYLPGLNDTTRALSTTYLTNTVNVTETVTVNSGVAYAMRPPNLTELYSDQPFAPLVRFGNSFAFGDSELNAEQNFQWDVGLTARQERTTWGARAFHATIHDYIGLAATNYGAFPEIGTAPPGQLGRAQPYMLDPTIPNQDLAADSASLGYIYRNLDRVTLYGFDLLAEHKVRPWLEVAGTLTFTEGINHDPTWVDVFTGAVTSVSDRESLPGIYPLSSLLTVRLVEPEHRKWTIEWQSRVVHEQFYLASSLGELGTPGFSVHNIHAMYRWTDALTLRSSLLNVFDLNYFEHNSLAIVDRNGNVGFVKNPGVSWFMGVDYSF
jgi:iron complex outermembrane recepter protein